MFGSIGLPEILLILVLALLIFGPKRLPEVGRTIGKGLSEFRRASADLKRTVNAELALDEDEHVRAPRRPEVGRTSTTAATAGATRPVEGTAPRVPSEAPEDAAAPGSPDASAAAPQPPETGPDAAPQAEPETSAAEETEAAATTTH